MPSSLSSMRITRVGATALVVAGALAISACGKKAPAQLPPDPGPATSTDTGQSSGGYGMAQPGSQADFVAKMMGADTIYFALDESTVDAQDQAALAKQAQWLQQYPNKRATIEGHCDERGTREYNIALGERRANAAKNYLASLGIDPSRITTVSYGKERPIALGSDEASWAQNRRAVTVTID
ncbi:peptidoglycan-associated lipoprotein Pal [Novosphingobium resinovorum]|uniref:peptidoglycan-associated lipoprotein Pal n=1 Tax=Novosphingobium TaxID=165696 RepID=UPI0025A22530|nr:MULTISPECIES: peptidoglycan-associated lipoprotein Pal [Novosphingobium]WJM28452.1 peptidoglycan-associated lipoprotein Pal [Novosphingobium resinovorum]